MDVANPHAMTNNEIDFNYNGQNTHNQRCVSDHRLVRGSQNIDFEAEAPSHDGI